MWSQGLKQRFAWPLGVDAPWLASPLFLLAFTALLSQVRPFDYFWALVQGRACLELGHIPTENLFLFTLPEHAPFFDQPWLSELAMFAAYRCVGHAANVVVLAVCLVLAVAILIDAALRLGAHPRAAALVALFALPLVALGAGVRTQMFAYPCFALLLRWCALSKGALRSADRDAPPARSAAALVACALVAGLWSNLHGTFVLAPLLFAAPLAVEIARAGRARRAPRALLLAGLDFALVSAATCVNPRGPLVYLYAARLGRAMRVAGTSDVSEWQALDVKSAAGAWFLLCVALSLGLLALGRRRANPALTLLFIALGVLSFQSQRFACWWALAGIPTLSSAFPAEASSERRGSSAANFGLLALFGAVLVVSLPGLPLFERLAVRTHLPYAGARVLGTETPLRIGEALARVGYRGRLFHDQALGGFIEWELASPGARAVAFVDQRFELTPAELWRDYFVISEAREGFRELLARYRIDALLIHEERNRALVRAIANDATWQPKGREFGYRLFVSANAH